MAVTARVLFDASKSVKHVCRGPQPVPARGSIAQCECGKLFEAVFLCSFDETVWCRISKRRARRVLREEGVSPEPM